VLTPAGLIDPLLDYFVFSSDTRSVSWMNQVAYAVRLFLGYLLANTHEHNSIDLFENFAHALSKGTFDLRSRLDPSDLCWVPRSAEQRRKIIIQLSEFFEWLGKRRPAAAEVNPRYALGTFDRKIAETAYQYRRNNAFLGHTWEPHLTPEETGYYVRPPRMPAVALSESPRFPDNRFEEFIDKGFRVGDRPDYRGRLITLLLHGAGFRESEPHHLFISDVFENPVCPGQAGVVIHHPSLSTAPSDWKDKRGLTRNGTRLDYLAQEYGLPPRSKMLGHRRAGWKGGLHDSAFYKVAYWFEPKWGEMFWEYWDLYTQQVACVPNRDHPFAFINLYREPVGGMYTRKQYNEAHARACERIGLTVSKALGSTPHGHRHAYAQRLRLAGFSPKLIQRYMHHISIHSQGVYTGVYTREMMAELALGQQRLHDKYHGTKSDSER